MVSAALRPGSVPDLVLLKAFRTGEVCASAETLDELAQVLERDKFDRYCDLYVRRSFVALIRRTVRMFAVQHEDMAAVDPVCRDPKENQFLALILAAEADTLISSDEDLLALHPWRGVPIVTPVEFLKD